MIGCGAEPTMYKHLLHLVDLGRNQGVPFIGIATNGQLLTEEMIRAFVTESLDELVISVHGVTAATYERFMPPARFQKLIEVLETLDSIRQERNSRKPALRINYTVNPDNLKELADFFTVFGKFNIRTLQSGRLSISAPQYIQIKTYGLFALPTTKSLPVWGRSAASAASPFW